MYIVLRMAGGLRALPWPAIDGNIPSCRTISSLRCYLHYPGVRQEESSAQQHAGQGVFWLQPYQR